MNTAHEFLFGALALQRRSIDADRLRLAYRDRTDGRPVGELLVERGWISPEARAEIDAEVGRHLDRLDGDHRLPLDEAADLLRLGPGPSPSAPPPTARAGALSTTEMMRFAEPTVTLDAQPTTRPGAADDSDRATVTADFVYQSRPQDGGASTGDPTAPIGPVRLAELADPPESPATRYTMTHLHAQGGIGQVWLAHDLSLGREVALKELKGDHISGAAWTRFVHEARITGQLEHPGVVPIHELSRREGDRRPFYTMRFVRGRTLREAIRAYHEDRQGGRAGTMDLVALAEAFVSVCRTIAYAHSRGVLHRDLKSPNVAIGAYGDVVVLDWGLAKILDRPDDEDDDPPGDGGAAPIEVPADGLATQPGQVLGTPAYMAPEQAAGHRDRIGRHSDVYGLGAILYEILAGRPPFDGAPVPQTLRMVREVEPTPPRRHNPDAPPALQAICLKAMAKDPEARYASAADLADDVRQWLADEPVSAYPDPWTKRASRWARRHRTAVAALGVLLATAAAAMAVGHVLVRRERDEAAAQREFARAAVHDMYTEVAEHWLEDHLDLRQREFLERALAYYRDFAGRDAGRPEVRREAARAYARVGDIQRKLGRPAESEPAYRRGAEILAALAADFPDRPEYRRDLAETRTRLAALLVSQNRLEEAEPLLIGAREALERPAAGRPADPSRRFALAQAEGTYAELLRLQRRNDEALSAYRRAAGELEALSGGPSATDESRREWARALDGLGVLLSEIGRPEEAREALERAAGVQEGLLARFPTVPRIREDLAKTSNSLGLLLRSAGNREGAERYLRQALRHDRRLADDFPDRPEYRRALGRGQVNLGLWLQDDGRLDEAEALLREAVASFERLVEDVPSEARPRRDAAIALLNLGSVYEMQDRLDEAAATYERARARYDELARQHPDVPDYRDGLADVLLNLGRVLEYTEGAEAASARLAEARAILEGLVRDHPDMASYRASLARCLAATGPVLAQSDPDAGREVAREAVAAYEALAGESPGSIATAGGLAGALTNLATLSDADAEKEALDRRALEVYEGLVEAAPEAREKLAIALNNLGEVLARTDRPREAADCYARAAGIFRELADAPGAGPTAPMLLAYVLANQGRLALDGGDPDAAATLLAEAVEHQREAAKAGRSSAYRLALQDQLDALSRAVLLDGRHGEAARLAGELSEATPGRPEARLRAARLLAQCVPTAEEDASLPPERRRALADSYGARAVAQLRVAVDAGLPPDRLDADADLTPIRDRDDFRSLLADLRAPAMPIEAD